MAARSRHLLRYAAVAVASAVCAAAVSVPAQAAPINPNVPYGATAVAGGGKFGVGDIYRDPQGTMWIANFKGDSIIKVGAGGRQRTYRSNIWHPSSLVAGPDGAIWFTEQYGVPGSYYGAIGRLGSDGAVTTYGMGKLNEPTSIVSGPEHSMWFTEFGHLGRITTTGLISLFDAPRLGGDYSTNVGNLVVGFDQRIWFTAFEVSGHGRHFNRPPFRPVVVRMNSSGTFSEFPVGPAESHTGYYGRPPYIARGPDHRLWVTSGKHAVSAVTRSGRVTRYVSTRFNKPAELVGGSGGVWVSSRGHDSIDWISPKGVVKHHLPLPNVRPDVLAGGAHHTLWFGQSAVGLAGRVHTTNDKVTLVAPLVADPVRLTAGGDGDLWFENDANGSIGRRLANGRIVDYWGPAFPRLTQMVWGPGSAMWFIRQNEDTVSRVTDAGKVTVITNKALKDPQMIVSGPQDAIWVLLGDKRSVARVDASGAVKVFGLPKRVAWIAGRPGSPLWWLSWNANGTTVGQLPSGSAAPTADCSCLPAEGVRPLVDADGALWFYTATDTVPASSFERVSTTGTLTAGAQANLADGSRYAILPSGAAEFTSYDYSAMQAEIGSQVLGSPTVLNTTPPAGDLSSAPAGRFVDLVPRSQYAEPVAYLRGGFTLDGLDTGAIGPDGQLWFAQQNLIVRSDAPTG